MSRITHTDDPDEFVRQNRDVILDVLKHGDDRFVRAAMLSLLINCGDDPDVYQVRQELERAVEVMG